MNPEIIDKDSFNVVGLEIKTSLVDGQFMEDVSNLIERALSSLVLDEVPNRVHPEEILGISLNLQGDGTYTFILGAEVTSVGEVPEGTIVNTIPAEKYAVFKAVGEMPFALMEKQEYIQTEWLPNSGYKAAKAPRFELYGEDAWETKDPAIKIYLPIEKS